MRKFRQWGAKRSADAYASVHVYASANADVDVHASAHTDEYA